MRTHLGIVAAAMLVTLACGSKPAADPQPEPAEQGDPNADAPPSKDEPEATFADPKVEPPPAPEGSITLPNPWLYVQTCAEPHPCPSLKQPGGDAHCRELRLGGYDNWRLPGKAEVERFRGVEGLEATAGYHWTRTPYEDDLGQVWIVDPEDPEGAPATTIPRDRKEFRIRCVKEP
jgi:hypothetical protein